MANMSDKMSFALIGLMFAGLAFIWYIISVTEPYKEICTCTDKTCKVERYYVGNWSDNISFNRYGYVDIQSSCRPKSGCSYTLELNDETQVFETSYFFRTSAESALEKIRGNKNVTIVKRTVGGTLFNFIYPIFHPFN